MSRLKALGLILLGEFHLFAAGTDGVREMGLEAMYAGVAFVLIVLGVLFFSVADATELRRGGL